MRVTTIPVAGNAPRRRASAAGAAKRRADQRPARRSGYRGQIPRPDEWIRGRLMGDDASTASSPSANALATLAEPGVSRVQVGHLEGHDHRRATQRREKGREPRSRMMRTTWSASRGRPWSPGRRRR